LMTATGVAWIVTLYIAAMSIAYATRSNVPTYPLCSICAYPWS
jgi:hypothetical protein